MRVMSCNIRYYGAADGANGWEHRRDFCIEVIRGCEPDVLCCQEVWYEQLEDLRAGLPGFEIYAVPDAPVDGQPVNSVLYRSARLEATAAATYWLSQTPHVPGSKSWDSACVRLASWVRLVDRSTRKELRVVNTHLDHVSQPAREAGARMLCTDAAAYPATFPQLLAGDMNCDTRNPAIGAFREAGWLDTHAQIHGPQDPGFTYHGFAGPQHADELGKIDWIFARGAMRTAAADIVTTQRAGRYPSDHYFLSVGVEVG